MVEINNDYITRIQATPRDLETLTINDELEINTRHKSYRIAEKQLISITDDEIIFWYDSYVCNIRFKDITDLWKTDTTQKAGYDNYVKVTFIFGLFIGILAASIFIIAVLHMLG